MSASEFFIWRSAYTEGECVITAPDPVEDDYEIDLGMSRAKRWPKNVVCRMSDEYPKDIGLTDNLFGAPFVVVSGGLRKVLEKEAGGKIEFLPVQIVNHKGKVASKDYFIVNPLGTVDCLDVNASGVTWNRFDRERMSGCKSFVIDPERVPADVALFRVKFAPFAIVARAGLVKKLQAQKFGGLAFQDARKYTGR